jgi:hypothetical protein
MSDVQSRLQKLEAAGILPKQQFTAEELVLVAKITDEEVEVLIRLREKLGAPADDKQHMRPNFFI